MKSFVYKDKTGQSWFIGFYSNNFEDRENEIISWKGHLDYAQWVKDNNLKLPITVAHLPKYPDEVHVKQLIDLTLGHITGEEFSESYRKLYAPYAFAQTEAVIPVNGFMLVVGKILKGKEDAVKLLSEVGWGMSHGYLALSKDASVIEQYRTFEFTSLPSAMAANMFTMSSIIEDNVMEVKGLSEQDRETLKQLINVDPTRIEEATKEAQSVLQRVVASKDLEEVAEPGEDVSEEPVAQEGYEELRNKIFADLQVDQLSKSFVELVNMVKSLSARIEELEPRIKETERTDDERIASQFFMPNWNVWGKSDADDVPEDVVDTLKESALGEKPVEGVKSAVDTDNPLYLGWMNPMGLTNQQ